ncbi:MAG TPA: hypothetical protein VF173_24945 [Thermoanaerobaculia bacterium]|nr:hypothetical protein [Thermoanaerobaculia bacterium]
MNREPDDELLRSYLLGKLPEEAADRLEGRLLAEDDLFELAEAVETDLLAAADRGGLVPEERERVMRRLASSPQGLERLAFVRSLNRAAAEKGGNGNVERFVPRAPAFQPRAMRWMAVAASLVMVTGLGWVAWKYRMHPPEMKMPPSTPSATQSVKLTPAPVPIIPPPDQTPRPVSPGTVPSKKPRHTVPAAVVALSLMTRGDDQVAQLHLSPGTPKAEIQIDASALDDSKSFSVVIRNDHGTVLETRGLKVTRLEGDPVLVVVVDKPAQRLAPGRYDAAVIPEGEEEMGTQVFEVVQGTL